uniref:ATP synthase subunit delta, chloroplastic n=1 Tax=Symphyocladiella dendroidea TaxID=2506487 RepID=A0A1Z1M7K1_9FLOR|nr:ATP synthase CF1 subunit delta [Symphyocladiella dendroidea]ARW61863.1 ATP synthase CF1 subunit delta [Symphyocladiella dendroidea]
MSNQNFKEKIAVPYAEALIDHAQSLNLLTESTKDLSSILTVISESRDLQILLQNPLINGVIKKEILKQLFENQVNTFVMNFLLVLVDRRRISLLHNIIQKYLELIYALESTTIAELYSAIDMTEIQQENLMQKIKSMTNSNQVKLVIRKDTELIGGFVIKIGSKIIDASLAGKLKRISLYLNTN